MPQAAQPCLLGLERIHKRAAERDRQCSLLLPHGRGVRHRLSYSTSGVNHMHDDAQILAEQFAHLQARAEEAEGFLERYFAPQPLTVFGIDIRAAACLVIGSAFAAAAIATIILQ